MYIGQGHRIYLFNIWGYYFQIDGMLNNFGCKLCFRVNINFFFKNKTLKRFKHSLEFWVPFHLWSILRNDLISSSSKSAAHFCLCFSNGMWILLPNWNGLSVFGCTLNYWDYFLSSSEDFFFFNAILWMVWPFEVV